MMHGFSIDIVPNFIKIKLGGLLQRYFLHQVTEKYYKSSMHIIKEAIIDSTHHLL